MIAPSPPDTAAALGLDVNGIMWCDATINPGLYGCAKVSPACTNCYAEEMAARIVRMGGAASERYAAGLTDDGRWTGRVVVDPRQIAPAFAKLPKRPGRIRRVFVTSMSDLFHEDVPFGFLAVVFGAMAARPWITFQVLTKRPERAAEFYAWLGADGRDEWETIINAADAYDGDGHEPPLLGGGRSRTSGWARPSRTRSAPTSACRGSCGCRRRCGSCPLSPCSGPSTSGAGSRLGSVCARRPTRARSGRVARPCRAA